MFQQIYKKYTMVNKINNINICYHFALRNLYLRSDEAVPQR